MKLLLLLTTAAVCAAADISVNLDLDDTPTSLRRGRKLARVDCNNPLVVTRSCPSDMTLYACEEGQTLCCTWTNLPVARDFRMQFRINRLVRDFTTDETGLCNIEDELDDESSFEDLLDEDLRLDEGSSGDLIDELDDEDSSEDILDELLDEEAEEFDEFDDEEFTDGSDE
eukprot:149637_1